MTIATSQNIDAADFLNGANMPAGSIIVWHGTIASIPSGWVICDGNNGTPNLLTRFVVGVPTAATNPGTTGGATAKTTSGHDHGGGPTDHRHRIPASGYDGNITEDYFQLGAWVGLGGGTTTDQSGGYSYGPTSSQTASMTMSSDDDSFSDIRPKYYDVAFLMKS